MFKIKIGKLPALVLVCGFSLMANFATAEEPTITVVVTPNPIGIGDYGQLSIEVAADLGTHISNPEFDAPDFQSRLSGRSQSSVSYGENGRIVSHTKTTFIFELQPKRTGNFKVSDIKVMAGTKEIKSPNLNVMVTAQGTPSQNQMPNQGQAPEEDEEESNPAFPQRFLTPPRSSEPNSGDSVGKGSHPDPFNSDFTVHVDLSKKSAYVGEPIIASFYLYDFGGVREANIEKWPTFNGFWKEDLELAARTDWETLIVNGRKVRRAFLARFALYGIKPGKITLDRMVVVAGTVDRQMQRDESDPFAMFFGSIGTLRKGKHASEEAPIEILQLPEAGKPPGFGGAVGQFTLKLEADKSSVPSNSPITVTASLSGRGNFQGIDGVKIPFPADFELYESTAKMVAAGRGTDGMKNFQSIVIPRKQGTFQIPPVEWSYFDPTKRSYVTIKSEPLNITVTEGTAAPTNQNSYLSNNPTGSNANEGSSIQAKEDLRYLKSSQAPGIPWKLILNILAASLAIVNSFLLGRLLWPHRAKLRKAVNSARPYYEAQSQLESVKTAAPAEWIDSVDLFFEKLNEGLLGISGKSMTMRELEEHWNQAGLAHSFSHQKKARDLLDTVRFGGSKAAASTELRAKVIQELAEGLRKAQTKA